MLRDIKNISTLCDINFIFHVRKIVSVVLVYIFLATLKIVYCVPTYKCKCIFCGDVNSWVVDILYKLCMNLCPPRKLMILK